MSKRSRTRSPAAYAEKYPALARRRHAPMQRIHDFSRVMIGHDHNAVPVYLDETPRLEHSWLLGATGSGKTTAMKNIALADFRRGRGGIVIDPHGSHPGSLYHELIAALHDDGFFDSGRVHLIDPNIRSHIVPINFLARNDDTDVSVLSDALLQAVERTWGDEDTHQKPTIRTLLKATFMTLAELGLPLTDVKLLFDPHDRTGFRARAISNLSNEYARDELERLHTTALDERSKRDFRGEVVGPINRINEFVSSDAIRAMLGVVDTPGNPRRTLDILDGMNKGDIFLVNLQHGAAVSEPDTKLLGALLLRYVFLLASRRTNREPFFMFIDECHRYLTGDIPNILAEIRKYGVGVILANQFLAQTGKPGDLIYEACMNSTEIKMIFRVKSPDEAQRLAEMVIPLDLERPVVGSVRPTVVGHRRVNLSSRGTSTMSAEGESEAETTGASYSMTESQSHGRATGTSNSATTGSGTFAATGNNTGTVMAPSFQLFGPNADNATTFPYALSESSGDSTAIGSSEQSTSSAGTSEVLSETSGTAESYGQSRASSTSRSRTHGTSESIGAHEAFESVYVDLPSSFHSKENELYRAGELLRALPVGRAFVSWRGRSVCITIPAPKRPS